MTSFESSIELPAPPERSWQFVVEHGEEVEPLTFQPDGVQGVGTLNHLSKRFLGVTVQAVSRTVTWDPPKRCEFHSVKPSWPVTAHIVEDFEPSAAGTRHVIRYDVVPASLVGHAVAPILAFVMKRSRRRYQERLRAALQDAKNST